MASAGEQGGSRSSASFGRAYVELVPLQLFDLDVKLADKDRPILCGAIAARADYLLTGDKRDFGHLFGRTISGVKIVSVQLLLADLIAQGLIDAS